MPGLRILVIEDDAETADYLGRGLSQEGHSIELVSNGQDGLYRATDGSFDLIILDRMVPVLDGLSLLRALRAAKIETPVLILSALASVGDRIEGLECGSDDYLVKPFSFAELLARLRALARRGSTERPVELVVGDLRLDPASRRVWRGGVEVALSPKEFALLDAFMRRPGQVLTRLQLIEHAWDFAYENRSNVVDVYVRYLREKLDRPFGNCSFETVRGVGYRLRNGDA